ncbi:IS3 family element, transposase orfA [Klebsiella pneumoniae]|uniref:IS3 family element, transposase orfA n=1 Tax=Klebsiella pneumoniae TaxID=573 RepID=A0A378FV63_KLEPN|nr:IS3 family element, transposase orfA [Klebsiella pneumoniae]
MKKTRYTEEQIAFALKQAETGTRVEEVCRKMVFLRPLFTSMDYLRFAST